MSKPLIIFTALIFVSICIPVFCQTSNAAQIQNAIATRNVPHVENEEEAEDLKKLKKGKWIVTSVDRDGETVPAKYGQKVGDIIGFEMDRGMRTVLT